VGPEVAGQRAALNVPWTRYREQAHASWSLQLFHRHLPPCSLSGVPLWSIVHFAVSVAGAVILS